MCYKYTALDQSRIGAQPALPGVFFLNFFVQITFYVSPSLFSLSIFFSLLLFGYSLRWTEKQKKKKVFRFTANEKQFPTPSCSFKHVILFVYKSSCPLTRLKIKVKNNNSKQTRDPRKQKTKNKKKSCRRITTNICIPIEALLIFFFVL